MASDDYNCQFEGEPGNWPPPGVNLQELPNLQVIPPYSSIYTGQVIRDGNGEFKSFVRKIRWRHHATGYWRWATEGPGCDDERAWKHGIRDPETLLICVRDNLHRDEDNDIKITWMQPMAFLPDRNKITGSALAHVTAIRKKRISLGFPIDEPGVIPVYPIDWNIDILPPFWFLPDKMDGRGYPRLRTLTQASMDTDTIGTNEKVSASDETGLDGRMNSAKSMVSENVRSLRSPTPSAAHLNEEININQLDPDVSKIVPEDDTSTEGTSEDTDVQFDVSKFLGSRRDKRIKEETVVAKKTNIEERAILGEVKYDAVRASLDEGSSLELAVTEPTLQSPLGYSFQYIGRQRVSQPVQEGGICNSRGATTRPEIVMNSVEQESVEDNHSSTRVASKAGPSYTSPYLSSVPSLSTPPHGSTRMEMKTAASIKPPTSEFPFVDTPTSSRRLCVIPIPCHETFKPSQPILPWMPDIPRSGESEHLENELVQPGNNTPWNTEATGSLSKAAILMSRKTAKEVPQTHTASARETGPAPAPSHTQEAEITTGDVPKGGAGTTCLAHPNEAKSALDLPDIEQFGEHKHSELLELEDLETDTLGRYCALCDSESGHKWDCMIITTTSNDSLTTLEYHFLAASAHRAIPILDPNRTDVDISLEHVPHLTTSPCDWFALSDMVPTDPDFPALEGFAKVMAHGMRSLGEEKGWEIVAIDPTKPGWDNFLYERQYEEKMQIGGREKEQGRMTKGKGPRAERDVPDWVREIRELVEGEYVEDGGGKGMVVEE